MSAWEKSTAELHVLKGLKSYIEDVIEDSEEIDGIKSEIYRNSQTANDNYGEAMDHASDIVYELNSDFQDEIDSLKNEIEDLKQMIEELTK